MARGVRRPTNLIIEELREKVQKKKEELAKLELDLKTAENRQVQERLGEIMKFMDKEKLSPDDVLATLKKSKKE